jgi:hypothetical protein
VSPTRMAKKNGGLWSSRNSASANAALSSTTAVASASEVSAAIGMFWRVTRQRLRPGERNIRLVESESDTGGLPSSAGAAEA